MARKLVFNPFTGTLDWIEEAAGGGGGGSYNIDKFTLSGTDITNKSVTLSAAPTTASDTRLAVIEGIEQDYGVDFTVSGSTLDWNGLGLESLLVAGDKIIVVYN